MDGWMEHSTPLILHLERGEHAKTKIVARNQPLFHQVLNPENYHVLK